VADRVKVPLLACAACAGAFLVLVLLAYAVAPFESLDARFLVNVGAEQGSHAFDTAEDLARLGDPGPLLVLLVGVCLLALSWGGKREALAAVVVVVGANVTTQALKVVLAHPRYQPYNGFVEPWANAFPSGHATAAASIGVALMLAAPPRLRPLAVVVGVGFPILVGASVVTLQWHFASDVIGGFLVAAGWGFAALAGLRLARPPEGARQAGSRESLAVSHD
jgi:membrane-associated phospholipid phosphatase